MEEIYQAQVLEGGGWKFVPNMFFKGEKFNVVRWLALAYDLPPGSVNAIPVNLKSVTCEGLLDLEKAKADVKRTTARLAQVLGE